MSRFNGVRGFTTSSSAGLTDDQIVRIAPAIFADGAHQSRSDRYTFVSTKDVFDGMRKEGFMPTQVIQAKTRDVTRRGFTKHLVRFRRADELNQEHAREVLVINSHDGGSAFKLMSGVYRYICGNGMIFGDSDCEISVPHKGDILGNVIEGAYSIVKDFEKVSSSIEGMRSIALSRPQQEAFAEAALSLRFNESVPVTPNQILVPRRANDNGNDVWGTFNRIQEGVVRGGLRGQTIDENGRRRRVTTREVAGIDGNVALNRALWILAERMTELAA